MSIPLAVRRLMYLAATVVGAAAPPPRLLAQATCASGTLASYLSMSTGGCVLGGIGFAGFTGNTTSSSGLTPIDLAAVFIAPTSSLIDGEMWWGFTLSTDQPMTVSSSSAMTRNGPQAQFAELSAQMSYYLTAPGGSLGFTGLRASGIAVNAFTSRSSPGVRSDWNALSLAYSVVSDAAPPFAGGSASEWANWGAGYPSTPYPFFLCPWRQGGGSCDPSTPDNVPLEVPGVTAARGSVVELVRVNGFSFDETFQGSAYATSSGSTALYRVSGVPEPETVWLLGTGIVVLSFLRRRRRPEFCEGPRSKDPVSPANRSGPGKARRDVPPCSGTASQMSVILLFLVASSVLTKPARAQTTTTKRGDFANTVNWASGYINAPAGPTTVSATSNGGLQPGVVGVTWGGGFSLGDDILFAGGGSFIQFDFAAPISGFGTQAWFNYFGGTIQFDEYLGGMVKGSWTYATGGGSGKLGTATFFGVLDDSGFDRVVMTGNASGFQEFAVNDLGVNATATPEPASLWLVGTGLLLGAGAARRRRSGIRC